MGEKRIVVPEGMLKAAERATRLPLESDFEAWRSDPKNWRRLAENIVTASLHWLSENPTVPTLEQIDELHVYVEKRFDGHKNGTMDGAVEMIVEWQRRMFLAPEPNLLDDLYIFPNQSIPVDLKVNISAADVNVRINEAYRRGQQSREK